MNIVGFNFLKISADRDSKIKSIDNISTSIDVIELTKESVPFLKESDGLKITFKYVIDYDPRYAQILFEGALMVSADPEMVKETLKQWKKKQLTAEFKIPLFNTIMSKCNLKALNLEEEMGLPLHIKFPHFSTQTQQNQ
jgi:hypothetical protein